MLSQPFCLELIGLCTSDSLCLTRQLRNFSHAKPAYREKASCSKAIEFCYANAGLIAAFLRTAAPQMQGSSRPPPALLLQCKCRLITAFCPALPSSALLLHKCRAHHDLLLHYCCNANAGLIAAFLRTAASQMQGSPQPSSTQHLFCLERTSASRNWPMMATFTGP
eukprot:474243-Pelagomonas_calceolata.AAC.1